MWGWIAKLLIVAGVFYAVYHIGVKAERGVQEVKYAKLDKEYTEFREVTKLDGLIALEQNKNLKEFYKLQAKTSKEKYDEKMAENTTAIAKYKSAIMRGKSNFRASLDNITALAGMPFAPLCRATEDELSRRLARLDERSLREIITPATEQQEYALSCNRQLIEIEAIRTKP